MKTIATICARGGSKGLPGKNLRPFAGKPLIAHSIEQALACPLVEGVYVSTDDEDIAAVARSHGAQVPYLRPAELATDEAPKLPAIEHLVRHLEAAGMAVDRIVDLQPTSPLRTQEDLRHAIEASEAACDLVVSVSEPSHSPYFSLVEAQADGSLQLSKPAQHVRRQDLPPVWGLNGSIYVWRRAALTRAATQGFWSVRVCPSVMPRERSVDIDDLLDFEWAEWLYRRAAS
ncbi:MAG: acylneuraminate cytidylyltransferase family protein [Burkholderiales bacterium]|nr:acylneuraminate cytidylyltransferase family protein [Burkholderiales bacterium]